MSLLLPPPPPTRCRTCARASASLAGHSAARFPPAPAPTCLRMFSAQRHFRAYSDSPFCASMGYRTFVRCLTRRARTTTGSPLDTRQKGRTHTEGGVPLCAGDRAPRLRLPRALARAGRAPSCEQLVAVPRRAKVSPALARAPGAGRRPVCSDICTTERRILNRGASGHGGLRPLPPSGRHHHLGVRRAAPPFGLWARVSLHSTVSHDKCATEFAHRSLKSPSSAISMTVIAALPSR